MAGIIDMKYNQQFEGVPVFTAADGTAQEVDAVRFTMSDTMGGTFEQVGTHPRFVADKTQPMDTASRTAVLKMDVDEAGVPNAFSDTWDVVVHGPSTPSATGATVTFNVTDQP